MVRCLKCKSRMFFIGRERVDFGTSYRGHVRTYGCLKDASCAFVPVPKKAFFFWDETDFKKAGNHWKTMDGSGLRRLSVAKLPS